MYHKVKLFGAVVLMSVVLLLFFNWRLHQQYLKFHTYHTESKTTLIQKYQLSSAQGIKYRTDKGRLKKNNTKYAHETTHDSCTSEGKKYISEKELLGVNNTYDKHGMANATYSRVYLFGKKRDIHVGDIIQVQIDLFDGYGRQRSVGGDYLRLWMVNHGLKATASGEVFDHNNGSYTGCLKALWEGNAVISVFIARRREEIALYYKMYRDHGSIWTIIARFRKGKFGETTNCSIAEPKISKIPWCNFTALNYGFPWYCEKPTNPNLSCDTWHKVNSQRQTEIGMSPTESFLYKWSGSISEDILSKGLSIKVLKDQTVGMNLLKRESSIPCNKLPPKFTWQGKSPKGFFYKNRWQSMQCTDTLPRNKLSYQECLRNKTLWLPGDSTSRQFFTSLLHTFHIPFLRGRMVHSPKIAHNEEYNITIKWQAHALPFYHGTVPHDPSNTIGEHSILDNLPNTTEDIVVFYLYAHMLLVHPNVFKQYVQRFVLSAKNLLERAPMVKLAVRGPHVFYRASELGLLSYWGLIYADILHEEFSVISDKVIYLDYWDMTVAKPCGDVHCPGKVISSMVHTMMSHLCFRPQV